MSENVSLQPSNAHILMVCAGAAETCFQARLAAEWRDPSIPQLESLSSWLEDIRWLFISLDSG